MNMSVLWPELLFTLREVAMAMAKAPVKGYAQVMILCSTYPVTLITAD